MKEREFLDNNTDAKIFCVFDWDTIYNDNILQDKHRKFIEQFDSQISNGSVTLCPSMPSIEYWFLLHFVDCTNLYKNCKKVVSVLGQYIKPCFSDSSIRLSKLLKRDKYLKDSSWVEKMCSDDKLKYAIERAEKNIKDATDAGNLDRKSYSFVYKVFI